MKRVSSNIERGKPKSMLLKLYKLLKMTYNDISEFFSLVSGAWRPSKCLINGNGVASPKYTAFIKRRSDKWNLEWPPPSLERLVIVYIRIINTSTVEAKYLCCPDWKRSQIFRNSFGKKYPLLNIYIRSPLTKSKNEHLKERKKRILLSTRNRKRNYTSRWCWNFLLSFLTS